MASFVSTGPNRVPRVLYFIAGMNPTDEQREDAARFGPNTGMRNAHLVGTVAMSALEECDAVAGPAIPKRYADTYPNVNDVDFGNRMLRMSDLDRLKGPVHSVDNEAARAARPPAFGQDTIVAQGAPRPHGAVTALEGGFVAPTPGNPDNLTAFGSERAENGPEGSNTEGKVSVHNPVGLSDAGVVLPRSGDTATAGITAPVAEGGGQGGFAPPKAVEAADDTEGATGSRRSRKGGTGDTGSTGDTGATG